MPQILIAYTTNSGSTEDVARLLAEELTTPGSTAEARRLEEVTDLSPYQAVIVGAPMILGWHRAAQRFVKKHQEALSQKKVAYFMTAISLTQPAGQPEASVPVCLDPSLARPPKNPARLSLKERYASVSNYLNPALRAAPLVKPVRVGFFAGKLELFRLNLFQMLFVMLVIQAQPGDFRNWDFIRSWAAGLRQQWLAEAAPAAPGQP